MDIDDLKSRVNLLEANCDDNEHYRHGLQADLAETEDRLKDTTAELDDKIDRLEAYSRRENLKFFGIPMSDNENRTACVQKVMQALRTAMPGKTWREDHIMRAHRLDSDDQNLQNQQNGQGRRETALATTTRTCRTIRMDRGGERPPLQRRPDPAEPTERTGEAREADDRSLHTLA